MDRGHAWIVATGVVAYLVFLAATAPARLVAFAMPEGLEVSGYAGSLWNGTARHALYRGEDLGRLEWTVRPWIPVRIEAGLTGPDIVVQASLRVGPRALRVRSLDAQAPAYRVARLAGLSGPVEAELALRDAGMTIRAGRPTDVAGELVLHEVTLALDRRIRLGGFRLTLGQDGDRISAAVRDESDVLDVGGEIAFDLAGHWEADLRIAPRGDDPDLRMALMTFGEPDADGIHHLRLRGGPE